MDRVKIEGSILGILEEVQPGEEFSPEENLLQTGKLDSLDFEVLFGKIEEKFDLELPPESLSLENCESVKTLGAMVAAYLPEGTSES